MLRLHPKSPQNLIPKKHRLVPRNHRFVPRKHRFVPKKHRLVPRNHRFVPRKHRFVPRNACRDKFAKKCELAKNGPELRQIVQFGDKNQNFAKNASTLAKVTQFAKNGPRLLKDGKIGKKDSLQNCSVCIQNPLKIWYRKSIVWYREIIVSYRESIVSYQEMCAETNLPKNVNWQKMVQNCVKLSNSGIKIKILPKMPLHWPQFAKNGPRLLKNGKIDKKGNLQNCSVCIQNPLKIWYRKSIVWYREIIVSYRESIVSFRKSMVPRNHRFVPRKHRFVPRNACRDKFAKKCELAKNGPELRQIVQFGDKNQNFAKNASTLAQVTQFAKNGPRLLKDGKIGKKDSLQNCSVCIQNPLKIWYRKSIVWYREIIVSYRESIVSYQEMRAETNLPKNVNWQKMVQNCVKLSNSGIKIKILPKMPLHWPQFAKNGPRLLKNGKIDKKGSLQKCSVCIQNPLKIWYRKSIVWYREIIVSYRESIVSYRKSIVWYREIIVSYRESIVSYREMRAETNLPKNVNWQKMVQNCVKLSNSGIKIKILPKMPLHWPQFAKNGPRLLKNGKIDKKGSLQKCSVCIQNPLKIWYRKSIVWYREIIVSYRESIVSYRKSILWYREIIVSYRESIVSYREMRAETNLPKNVNWQKMVQNCVKLSNSGIKIRKRERKREKKKKRNYVANAFTQLGFISWLKKKNYGAKKPWVNYVAKKGSRMLMDFWVLWVVWCGLRWKLHHVGILTTYNSFGFVWK